MTLGDLLRMWRRRIDDTAKPYLWSDDDGVLFANEAEREASERALLLEEDSPDSPIVNIDGEADVGTYTLDERIIEVRSVRWGGHQLEPISRKTLDSVSDRRNYGSYFASPWGESFDWTTLKGTPRFFLSPQSKYLTLVRIPTAAAPIKLSVYRFPLEAMVLADLTRGPEIHPRYHLHLIDWMEYLTYDNVDADKGNPERARKAEAAFTKNFGPRLDADTQRSRRENNSNQVVMNPDW